MPKYLCHGLILFFACSTSVSANDYPVTIVDDRNKEVVFHSQPKKVASVSVFGADLMHALGLRAAGLSTLNHQQSPFLGTQTQSMVDLGEVHETNLEMLSQLNPDLTIGIRTYTEPFEKKFEQVGHFLAFDMITLADSNRIIELTGAALGYKSQAQALNKTFAEQLNKHQQRVSGNVSVVMLWHWGNVQYAFYDHHLSLEIMRQLGAKNAMGPSPTPEVKKIDSAPLSMEALLKLNPDVIISFKGEAGPVTNHPVWSRLSAVKNGRAYRVADQYVMPHGPIARDMVLREVAHLLYPDSFARPADIPMAARASQTQFSHD